MVGDIKNRSMLRIAAATPWRGTPFVGSLEFDKDGNLTPTNGSEPAHQADHRLLWPRNGPMIAEQTCQGHLIRMVYEHKRATAAVSLLSHKHRYLRCASFSKSDNMAV